MCSDGKSQAAQSGMDGPDVGRRGGTELLIPATAGRRAVRLRGLHAVPGWRARTQAGGAASAYP